MSSSLSEAAQESKPKRYSEKPARRVADGIATLMQERITSPLGISSTALSLPRDLLPRAVQGYGPMGRPGEESGVETTGSSRAAVLR
jgi:CubicO group peptidase (beta-lactamase class C family)